MKIAHCQTAKGRVPLSLPAARALEDGLLSEHKSFLDCGCGRGGDLGRATRLGIRCDVSDPVYRPHEVCDADVVNLGYVINIIESVRERESALRRAWSHAREVLVVSASLTDEARVLEGERHGDGYLTPKGTLPGSACRQSLAGAAVAGRARRLLCLWRSRASTLSRRTRSILRTARRLPGLQQGRQPADPRRKEPFDSGSYPHRNRFARLTPQESHAGLDGEPWRIGTLRADAERRSTHATRFRDETA